MLCLRRIQYCAFAAAGLWLHQGGTLLAQTPNLPVPFAPSTLPGAPAAPAASEAPMPPPAAPAKAKAKTPALEGEVFPSGRKRTSLFEIELICEPAAKEKLSLTATPIEAWVAKLRDGNVDEVLRHKEKGLPILIAAIQDEKASGWVRLSMKSVREDRDWLIPVYIAGVDSPGPFTARECIEELGRFGTKLQPHLPGLLKTVQKAGAERGFDDWFRREALKALDEAEASNEQYIQFVLALHAATNTSFIKVSETELIEALLGAGPESIPAALDMYAPLLAGEKHLSAAIVDADYWPPLVEQLASKSSARRRAAAWLLAEQHRYQAEPRFDAAVLAALISYCRDPDPRIRRYVLQALEQQPPQAAKEVATIAALFVDLQYAEGSYAAGILGKCGAAALPAIQQAAQHPQAALRARAAQAYKTMIPFPFSEATLLEALARDESADVRGQAIRAIAETKLSTPEAIAALEAALADKETVDAARHALERLGPAANSAQLLLRAQLTGATPAQQMDTLRTLSRIAPESSFVAERLMEILTAELATFPKTRPADGFEGYRADDVTTDALQALGNLGDSAKPAIDLLLTLAESTKASARRSAVETLQRIGPTAKEAAPRLIAMVDTTDGFERQSVIDALGEILPDSEWPKQSKALRAHYSQHLARKLKRRQIAEKTPAQIAKAKVKEFVYARGGDYSENTVMESKFQQGAMVSISLHHDAISDAELPNLAPLEDLRSLHLTFTEVSDEGLKHVGKFTNLRSLGLGSTEITGAGVQHLRGLQKLISLELSMTKVGDQGLHHVAQLPALEALYLVDTKVTDAGLRSLPALKKLHTLYLSNTAVGDAGLEQLGQCAELKELLLPSTKVTDAGLPALRTLTKLEELNLEGTKVTGAGLEGVVSLREVNLAETRATGAGLATLVRLKWLRLANTPTNVAGLQGFRALKQLETLSLEGTLVTDAALEELSHLPKLNWLDLTGTRITDKGLKQLGQLQSLSQLDLNATEIGDEGLAALDGLKNLQSLNISDTNVTAAGVAAFKKKHPGCYISQ